MISAIRREAGTLTSTDQLVDALRAYRGAIVLVSHDEAFTARLDLTTTIELA